MYDIPYTSIVDEHGNFDLQVHVVNKHDLIMNIIDYLQYGGIHRVTLALYEEIYNYLILVPGPVAATELILENQHNGTYLVYLE